MAEIRNRATLDSTQFQAGLKGMQGGVQNLGQSLRAIPGIGSALSVAGLAMMARNAMNTADEIDNLSRRLGLGIEEVQTYKIALEEAGLGTGNLESAVTRLDRAQAEAIAGNTKYQQSFDALGISQQRLARMNTSQVLEAVGKSMGDLEGDSTATSASYDLLGRNAGKLRDVLIEMNKDGIQAQIDKYKELGLVMDEHAIRKLDEAQLRVDRLGTKMSNFATERLAAGIDGFELLAGATKKAFNEMSNLEKLHLALGGPGVMAKALVGLGKEGFQEVADEVDAPSDAAKAAREEREAAARKRALEEIEQRAGGELDALEEKRRVAGLTSDELRKELDIKLEVARIAHEEAQSAVAKLEALKQIHDLESQIARIKTDDVEEERKPDQQFGELRRMGANMRGSGAVPGDMKENRRLELMRQTQKSNQDQLQVLRDILNSMGGGARL